MRRVVGWFVIIGDKRKPATSIWALLAGGPFFLWYTGFMKLRVLAISFLFVSAVAQAGIVNEDYLSCYFALLDPLTSFAPEAFASAPGKTPADVKDLGGNRFVVIPASRGNDDGFFLYNSKMTYFYSVPTDATKHGVLDLTFSVPGLPPSKTYCMLYYEHPREHDLQQFSFADNGECQTGRHPEIPKRTITAQEFKHRYSDGYFDRLVTDILDGATKRFEKRVEASKQLQANQVELAAKFSQLISALRECQNRLPEPLKSMARYEGRDAEKDALKPAASAGGSQTIGAPAAR